MEIALVGNPNCGKTTLFNSLTGSNQRVGNWAGDTIERKTDNLKVAEVDVKVVDLPGIYSLIVASTEHSTDEKIACQYLIDSKPDYIVNVIDASQLERCLYLTTQLQQIGIPIIIVLNMLDILERDFIEVDPKQLAKQLDCPVITLAGNKKQGLMTLKQSLMNFSKKTSEIKFISSSLNKVMYALSHFFKKQENPLWYASRYLEADVWVRKLLSHYQQEEADALIAQYQHIVEHAFDIFIAQQRYQWIESILETCLVKKNKIKKPSRGKKIDSWILNRFIGLPIFFFIMYLMFIFAINIGGVLQDCFDQLSQLLFVDTVAYGLTQLNFPVWMISILAIGVGKGLATTFSFIPVITAMFFALAFLESCGYMARAAFVMDRVMRALGLPGKSFVPMIIGFGCNVPAVLAARTLESQRDRILTILMSPFMSCGARLAIFTVFIAAFFPQGGQNIIFLLYLIGISMAVFTGIILRKTILMGNPSPLIMELPRYHWPTFKTLFYATWFRLRSFVKRAVKVIVPLCMILGFCNSMTIDGQLNLQESHQDSILSLCGKALTPIVAPMGIEADNWPATVGIATGMIAKEVVVGTLNTLYNSTADSAAQDFNFKESASNALQTIPEKIYELPKSIFNPIVSYSPDPELEQSIYGTMYQKFGSQAAAFAYLLFILLYFPCISTTAVMLKELNSKWAAFSVIWTTCLAYFTSVCFFQLMNFSQHPFKTLAWLGIFFIFIFLVIIFLRKQGLPPASEALTNNKHIPPSCSQCSVNPQIEIN